MPDFDPTRLRSRRGLLFTVLPAIAVLAVLGVVLAVAHRESVVHDRHVELESTAVAAATNARRFVDDQLATLGTAAASPGVRRGVLPVIRDYLPEVARYGRFSSGVGFADRSLRLRAFSGGMSGGRRVTLRGRSYAEAALREGRPMVSDVLIGRTTGAPVLVFAHPIEGFDRRRTGVLTGAVRLDVIEAAVKRLLYSPQSGGTIVDGHGYLIVNGSQPVRMLERAPASFDVADMRRRKQGVDDDVSGPEGRLMAAFATVPDLPWLVVIDRPYGEVVGALDTALAAEIVALCLLALLGALVTLAAARRLDRLDAERDAALEEQRTIAVRLQRSLLPDLPAPASVQVHASYTPAAGAMAVGGDWYDVVGLPDGSVALSMGDVAGHGLGAAAVMGQLRSAVRMLALGRHDPADAVARLDEFGATLDGRPLATVVIAVLDPPSGLLRYACAGHPPPLLVHGDGTTEFLQDGRSPLLGVDVAAPRPVGEAILQPGDTLVLYTDGLIERPDRSIDDGLAALAHAAAAAPRDPETLATALLAEVEEPRRDDAAVLCLRLVPEAQPSSVAS